MTQFVKTINFASVMNNKFKVYYFILSLFSMIYFLYYIKNNRLHSTHYIETDIEYIFSKESSERVCKPRCNLAFLKTHKCASSSIQNMLFRYGLKNNLSFALPSASNYFGRGRPFRADMVTMSKWNKPNVNIYAIHTKWNIEEMEKLMPKDTYYFSIVREPSEVFESLFSYGDFEKVTGLSLDKFVTKVPMNSKRINGYLGYNQMVYDFGLPDNNLTIDSLNFYLKKWDDHFDLVILADRLEESLIILKDKLCWDLQDVLLLKTNAREKRYKIPINLDTKLRLQQRLQLDYILYDHFVTKFNKEVIKFGKERMQEEIKSLREAVKDLEKRCDIRMTSAGNIYGQNRPFSNKVNGFQGNLTDETCRNLIKSELSFITYLLNRQKRMRLKGHMELPFGAVRVDHSSIKSKFSKIDNNNRNIIP